MPFNVIGRIKKRGYFLQCINYVWGSTGREQVSIEELVDRESWVVGQNNRASNAPNGVSHQESGIDFMDRGIVKIEEGENIDR